MASNQVHPSAGGLEALASLQQTHDMGGGAWSVTVLPENTAAWAAYKQALQSAQHSILIVMWYVFQDDHIITEVTQILKSKLQQGVKVKLIYSNSTAQEKLLVLTGTEEGTPNTDAFVEDMRQAGAELVDYSKDVAPTRGTHRKALVVDNTLCITGSRNIHWIYYDPLTKPKTHAEICLLIRNGTSDVVGRMAQLLASGENDAVSLAPPSGAELVQSKPHHKLNQAGADSSILHKYIQAINSAKKTILLVQWSFIPQGSGDGFLDALVAAVKRGVQVRAVFNGRKQTSIQARAGEASLTELLLSAKGNTAPKVYVNDSEHVIHCKYGVFDGVKCFLGSFNIDDYSFDKNAEALMVIENESLAANLFQHSEWLRLNMPCIPATPLSGWARLRSQVFGCCATAVVEAAV